MYLGGSLPNLNRHIDGGDDFHSAGDEQKGKYHLLFAHSLDDFLDFLVDCHDFFLSRLFCEFDGIAKRGVLLLLPPDRPMSGWFPAERQNSSTDPSLR